MLSESSLRKTAHSASLRATGSFIDFCSSMACSDLPLRTAAIASLTAASSTDGVEDVGATVNDGVFAWAAVAGALVFAAVALALSLAALSLAALSLAALSLPAALSFAAPFSFDVVLSFAAALSLAVV